MYEGGREGGGKDREAMCWTIDFHVKEYVG